MRGLRLFTDSDKGDLMRFNPRPNAIQVVREYIGSVEDAGYIVVVAETTTKTTWVTVLQVGSTIYVVEAFIKGGGERYVVVKYTMVDSFNSKEN